MIIYQHASKNPILIQNDQNIKWRINPSLAKIITGIALGILLSLSTFFALKMGCVKILSIFVIGGTIGAAIGAIGIFACCCSPSLYSFSYFSKKD